MVIKSGPWGVITAHKVIKQVPRRVGTLEPGGWGPRSVSYPGALKPQCPQAARADGGLALSCLEVEQMMPEGLGQGWQSQAGRLRGTSHPFLKTAVCGSQRKADGTAAFPEQQVSEEASSGTGRGLAVRRVEGPRG